MTSYYILTYLSKNRKHFNAGGYETLQLDEMSHAKYDGISVCTL